MKALAESPQEKSQPADDATFDRRVELVMEAVDLHHTYLLDYLFRLTRHIQDAEDILQELWCYALRNLSGNQIKSLPLLRRKAYCLFIDRYRANERKPEVLTDEVPETAALPREQVFSELEEERLKHQFWDEQFPGILLSESQKNVLWAYARYGWTYQEIEERLGVPSSTVGDWIAIGRQRMSEYLNAEE